MLKQIFPLLMLAMSTLPLKAQTAAGNVIKERYGSFAVIGDSYSTFMGFTDPLPNAQWYPHAGNAMTSVNQTWWKLFERDCDITLEQNNSFSGSTICTHSWNNTTDLQNSFVGRVENLREAGLIIVEGATNDNNAGSAIGQYVWSDFTAAQKRTFRGGTAYVIDYLQRKYPNAQVVFMLNNGLREDINSSVATICEHYNVPLLRLHDITKIEDHPDVAGMEAIRTQLVEFLCELNGVDYITYDTDQTFAQDKANSRVLVAKPMRKGEWSSLCLPFDMPEWLISDVFGQGTQVQTFGSLSDGTLQMKSVSAIEAHKPYIIRPAREIKSSFAVAGATIKAGEPIAVGQGSVWLSGVYSKTSIRKGKKDRLVLTPRGTWRNTANLQAIALPMDVVLTNDESNPLTTQLDGEEVEQLPLFPTLQDVFTPVAPNNLHSPATPIITADPYLSIWMESDMATDADTRSINGKDNAVRGYIEVDGTFYRFLGGPHASLEKKMNASGSAIGIATQLSCTITATTTYFRFAAGNATIDIAFTAPQVVTEASTLDAAVNYIYYKVESADGADHDVKLYLAPSYQLAQRNGVGTVSAVTDDSEGFVFGRIGTNTQALTEGMGANWGYTYLMADEQRHQSLNTWTQHIVLCDTLSTAAHSCGYTLIGRDENAQAIGFGYARFPAPWVERYHSFGEVLIDYARNIDAFLARARAFDKQLYDDALASGGSDYADICQMVYRQVVAGCKRAQSDTGKALLYNVDAGSSWNVCQADQVLSSAPLFLLYNPQLALDLYEATPDYIHMYPGFYSPYGNAPYCLGTAWPVMAGSILDYGVDSTTDLCITAGAAVIIGKNAEAIDHYSYEYLKSLCDYLDLFTLPQYQNNFPYEGSTDGNNAQINNYANLHLKAVLSMQFVAEIAGMKGEAQDEAFYSAMADRWAATFRSTFPADDHYRQGTNVAWGQKYPLFYDKVLQRQRFEDVIAKELAYYAKQIPSDYGLQLDARSDSYAKVHATMLTAALDAQHFANYVAPIYQYVNTTASRRPIADVYNCQTAQMTAGQGSVALGSVWAKVLIDKLGAATDGIEETTAPATANRSVDGIYNIAGQRLEKMQRGVNIVGGKKIVIK